jgi:hypothetical protein
MEVESSELITKLENRPKRFLKKIVLGKMQIPFLTVYNNWHDNLFHSFVQKSSLYVLPNRDSKVENFF